MKTIPYGTIPQVLLIGNGINRSFEGASWDALINECEAVKSGRISLEAIQNTSLWHIHGNAFYKHSIIMGHYYYGMLLAEIEKYIPVLQARYRGCNQYRKDYQPHSWVDYFLIGDVHIVGMGMDLWWLAYCKKRNFPDRRTIFYNPDGTAEEKTILMNCYGIEEVKDISWNGNYVEYYKNIFQRLQKKV